MKRGKKSRKVSRAPKANKNKLVSLKDKILKYFFISMTGLVVLLLVGAFFVGYSNDSDSTDMDGSLASVPSRSSLMAGTAPPQETGEKCGTGTCKECSQTCINNQCTDTGKYICPSGSCVFKSTDPYTDNCACSNGCDPCTERCSKDRKTCQPTGRSICPDGTCQTDCSLHQCGKDGDERYCNPFCERCVITDPFRRTEGCEPIVGMKKCQLNYCVSESEKCPEEYKCKPCVEVYDAINKICKPSGNIICPYKDGTCMPQGSDCSKLPKIPIYYATPGDIPAP